ncbi:diadenylate cyclase CdaA [Prosthecobacter sp.]|uniref:diadenylate cyclase CdaA n=1 Tax=Prosthecobacter sp. TaxID=1965333 RepID=UPI003784FBF6
MPSFPRSSTARNGMWDFLTNHWRDGVEIIILAALAYHGYLFFRATRGARILTGLLILLLGLALISLLLELSVISSLLQRFSVFLAIALVIIFQPELRRVLAELGSSRLFSFNRPDPEALDVLMEAMQQLSSRRCGALFALKRGIDLKPFAESGVELDAVISVEMITTIFHPKTSLHDGGVIIDQGRIAAAGCVFPVSQKDVQDRAIGLRHRAGMGVTEETDAIALVVSEETGALSLCYQGRLEHDLEPDELRRRINEILNEGAGASAATNTEDGHELGTPA